MKVKPEIYANVLISALSDKSTDPKKIAANFWYTLQRNNQGKDLKQIFAKMDEEYAKKQNKTLAKIYSAAPLSEAELAEIKTKLEKEFKSDFLLQNIIKKSEIAGIVVKVNEKEIDLSLGGKMNRLKQLLKSPNTVETI